MIQAAVDLPESKKCSRKVDQIECCNLHCSKPTVHYPGFYENIMAKNCTQNEDALRCVAEATIALGRL